ncbi:nucleoprotein TPR-like [Leptidea sinapis]|uniref:nucleoprotein TPR-like n=1 Tax=Leptidea sinapis TaxID=189913 RepID=UPI0021C382D1|nr:nucleoprotein TPR-like [Leptidea sinapis]
MEVGDKSGLSLILSETELVNIPNEIAEKINKYIDQEFGEHLTVKALLESTKCQFDEKIKTFEDTLLETTSKYEDATKKLLLAEETITKLEDNLKIITTDLQKSQNRVIVIENENISLKSARDAAVAEKNDLARIVERYNMEIERLTANEVSLSKQLRAAIDAKCEAWALNDEIKSKENSLQYREKQIEQERASLNSRINSLTDEVDRLTSELQTVRLNNTSRVVNLETQLAAKVQELKIAKDQITELNEINKKLNNRVEKLTHRLKEQGELENKMAENYKMELEAKTKLADLFKSMHDDAEAKTTELTEGILELQKLLNEATEKYGDLETKFKQAEIDQEELIEKKNEIISSLKTELEHANDLLKASHAQNLEAAVSELAPSAAAASRLIKSGMTLTQIYSQIVKISDELAREKEENRQLNLAINSIVQELEEKAPLLKKEKTEYIEAMETNTALSQQIESLTIECNRLRDDYSETSKIASHYNRENTKLKGELADLGRQVCFLLKEIEYSRGGLVNGDHDSSHSNTTSSSDLNSSRMISKTLVTFSDIQELQSNNQKLLRMIRELTDKQEELEQQREQFEGGALENKYENLKQRVVELTEAQDRQIKMINGLIRQRDMFKKLYHDQMKGKRLDESLLEQSGLERSESISAEITQETTGQKVSNNEVTKIEGKLKEAEKHLEMLKEEYKVYKQEKTATEKMLLEQAEVMRQEIVKLTAANSKSASTLEYNDERIKILQTNITTYKKQISTLEEKNEACNTTIAKHEVSLQHLRDEFLNTQGKLKAAEVQIQNLKTSNKLLKDAELRLQTEKEVLNRERQGQSVLLKNLELIKASLEKNDADNRMKIESRLDEATRECAALRRRLQEEQDRFRELSIHLERETETAKARMQEEKDAADILRTEVQQLKINISEKIKLNEDLSEKLKSGLGSVTDDSLITSKKIRELEIKLSDKDHEISSYVDQLNKANEHIKQYCNIAEDSENNLNNLNKEYENYKLETNAKLERNAKQLQVLEEKCAELEAEISLQGNGEYSNINDTLRNEIEATKEELTNIKANYEECRKDLDVARTEISSLSEAVQKAEDKYSHELMLHSSDLKLLSKAKEDLSRVENELNEMVTLKNSLVEKVETQEAAWAEKEKVLAKENEELVQRLKDLNDQNSLLHDQIQALGTQLSVSHTSKSFSESINESANDSNINISVHEDDVRSSEQLFQIVKFLRKEKDIVMAKFEMLQAETRRLKSQLEINEKQLDESKLALAAERERSEVTMVTVDKQSDILRKLEAFNAITDSNRFLREESASLSARVEDLTKQVKILEDEMTPLQDKISDLTSKNETLQSENKSLKADCARWRSRVNSLVERANKTSPEDWKRLQNERETLAKMLTIEKENNRKVTEELSAVKIEKIKLEEQYTSISYQQNNLIEENNKLREELRVIKEEMEKLSVELARIKNENTSITDANTKMTEDLSSKEASLTDIRNKEMQIRKIAKKYKGQYEELAKTVEEEKKKLESDAAAAEVAMANNVKQIEEQLKEVQAKLELEKTNNDQLKQELEVLRTANLDKEEKAKAVLKHAKSKIVQLTEIKNSLSRDLEEARSKIESVEQSNRDEQDVRLALIKSQYEGRLSRLEKERGEAQAEKSREVEALMQKVNLLQRQLASQASVSKQQITAEKSTSEPPTANIKPMAGVAPQSVSARGRGGDTPLASIRPMAQVGPTAPHDAHTTEYMPASSSRPLTRAAVAASAAPAPPESTQDMDTSEAGMAGAGSSDSTTQSTTHSQTPQQAVALVLPRIEQPSGTSGASGAANTPATAAAGVQPPPTAPGSASTVGGAASGAGPSSVSTSHPTAAVSTSHTTAAVGTSHPAPIVTTSHTASGISASQSGAGVSTSHPVPGVSTSHPAPGVSTSHPAAGVSTSHPAPGVSTSHPAPGVSTSHPAPGVSTSHPAPGVSTSHPAPGVSTSHPAPGVSTSHPPADARPQKRRLQARPLAAKRTRVEGFERSEEVEYQVPTSSRCDQDDEGVIVVDSEEDDERCSGTMYREGEEDDEDIEEEQDDEAGEEEEEVEGENSGDTTRQDSPAQSPEAGDADEAGEAGEVGEVEGAPDSEPAAQHQQIEAISSGTEPSGTLSIGGNGADEGDDSIVPSTPTLYVPRRNDGFGEAVVSPLGGANVAEEGAGATGARFTFAEAAHHDTHADLAAALPAQGHARAESGESNEWEESRNEEEAAAVSSQGSEPSSPQQEVAEEGREAEASSMPQRASPASPAPAHSRWMRAADSESGLRGRGRPRGRSPRRSHNYMRF